MSQASDLTNVQAIAASPVRAKTPWYTRRESDRINLIAQCLFFGGLSYGAMILYYFDVLPLIGLVFANVAFYIRAYSRMHDLCHAFPTSGWAVRFLPSLFFANPIWGGTRAFITTHVDHHKYLGTDRDPWRWYYTGRPIRAFFFNMIEPEVNLYNYLKRRGLSRNVAENLAFDLLFQVVNVLVFQGAYLVHLAIQRTWHGIGIFLFNFYPHRSHWSKDATIGNFNREEQVKRYAWIIRLIFGKPLLGALYYHNRHHVLGQIHIPSHQYELCSDEGDITRFTKDWPLESLEHLDVGRAARAS